MTSAAPFLVGWTVMRVAMMLPSVGPRAIVYHRSSHDPAAMAALAIGYLFVWVATGFAALAAVRAVDVAAAMAPAWAALIALIVFVEKVLPRSVVAARALGVVVVVAGAAYGIGS